MPQLFPRYTNTLARAVPVALVLGLGVFAWGLHTAYFGPFTTDVGQPVAQTVPFSHQHHVAGLGIDCRYCHTGVEQSAFAGIPPTETCMTCHSQIWRDAPMLAPVRESWATGKPLRWNRVHNLPAYTYFNHSIHVQKGIACVSCHGRVDQMPLVRKEQTLYMRWCLDCHRAPERHVQPVEAVFVVKDENITASKGVELVHAYGIHKERLADCSICHR